MDIMPVGAVSSPGSLGATVPSPNSVAGPPTVVAPALASSTKDAKPTAEAVQQAVDLSNKALEAKTSNELLFSVVKGAGISVVKLVERESGKAIMQFPSQQMIEIAKNIDQLTGAIIKKTA